MVKFTILFFFVSSVFAIEYQCYTRYYYQNVCYRFSFNGECQPWALEHCKATRITRHDLKCPRFFCDVSFSFYLSICPIANILCASSHSLLCPFANILCASSHSLRCPIANILCASSHSLLF